MAGTSSLSKVTVIGASGNIGSIITKYLLSSGIFQVSALTRENSTSTFPPQVTPIRVPSYEFSHLKAAFQGQDIVISTISTSSLGDQFAIAKAVVEAGVKRFIPAELGMDSSSEDVMKVAPCMFLKRDVIKYLREYEDVTSWTGVFCGLWIDFSLKDPGWRYWNLQQRRFTIFDDGSVPFDVSTLEQTAKAVVASIHPDNLEATRNQFVYVRSATYTPNQLLKYLKDSTDDKWTIGHVDIQQLASQGQNAFREEVSSGEPPEIFAKHDKFQTAIIDMVSAALMGNGGVNQFGNKVELWMDKFGLKEEDGESLIRNLVSTAGTVS